MHPRAQVPLPGPALLHNRWPLAGARPRGSTLQAPKRWQKAECAAKRETSQERPGKWHSRATARAAGNAQRTACVLLCSSLCPTNRSPTTPNRQTGHITITDFTDTATHASLARCENALNIAYASSAATLPVLRARRPLMTFFTAHSPAELLWRAPTSLSVRKLPEWPYAQRQSPGRMRNARKRAAIGKVSH